MATTKSTGRTTPKKVRETEPQVTSASEWRNKKKKGQIITLPSGLVARVMRVMDLMEMIKNGKIPSPLTGVINNMVSDKTAGPEKASEEQEKLDPDAVSEMLKLIDDCVARAMVEPKVEIPPEDAPTYWEPEDEDAISINDMELDDRFFIFTFAQGFASDLESFRKGQAAFMAGVPDGEGVSNTP